MWHSLGPVINPRKHKKRASISKRRCDGSFTTNDQIISNHMDNFFCNIGKQFQSRIPNYGVDYKRYLPQSVNKTFFLTPVHSDELIKELKSLNPKKSSGPDNINAKFINLCPNIYAENLTNIFKRAIKSANIRFKWKWLKWLHSMKKGKRYKANNYRRSVMKFLNANNILFKFKNGFR